MHTDVNIILKLVLKIGDIRKLTGFICQRTEAEKRIVGLKQAQLFFDLVDKYKVFKDSAGWN
jgi:hypothetical protein